MMGPTFDDVAELLTYLGLVESEGPQLGVLLERFTPGKALDLATVALFRGHAKFIRENRPEPPKLEPMATNPRWYRPGL